MIHQQTAVRIPVNGVVVEGDLTLPPEAKSIVIFAHGSGGSRFSPRNKYVAKIFNNQKIGTLLFDLLTDVEDQLDIDTAEYRFNIPMLADRLIGATEWLKRDPLDPKLQIRLLWSKHWSCRGFGCSCQASR